MNNKIVSTKTTSAIFLAIVLIAGTITALSAPSFMIGIVQAQSYYRMDSYEPDYGMDNSYDKRSYGNDNGYESQYQPFYKPNYKSTYPSYDGKDNRDKFKDSSNNVNVKKIKCNNINLNVNGGELNETSFLFLTGIIGEKESDANERGVSSYGSGGSYEGYSDSDNDGFAFICINNNNNVVIGGNQTIPPEPPKATLNVTKLVNCQYILGNGDPCPQLTGLITEDQFDIEVTDDNPVPSQFAGSESGTLVTLGAGNYVVSETPDASIEADLNILRMQLGTDYTVTGPIVTFTGDCTPVNLGSEATGTIGAGESQTCNIINSFTIRGSL